MFKGWFNTREVIDLFVTKGMYLNLECETYLFVTKGIGMYLNLVKPWQGHGTM